MELENFFKLLNPSAVMPFFENMTVRSANYMFIVLLFCGLFLFAGYAVNSNLKIGFGAEALQCPLVTSLEAAFVTAMALIMTPFIAALVLSLFSKNISDREVDSREIVSVLSYPVAVILLSGIFKAHVYTVILHYIFIAYAVYLLYSAITARFGFDKAILYFILFLIVASIVFMVLFWFGTTVISTLVGFFELIGFSSADIPLRRIPKWCY